MGDIWICEHQKVTKWDGDILAYKNHLKAKVMKEANKDAKSKGLDKGVRGAWKYSKKCSSIFSQTPKVDHFIFTCVSTDLLELLPVQATGDENVRWSFMITFVRSEHCQAEARKLLFTAPVKLLIEI